MATRNCSVVASGAALARRSKTWIASGQGLVEYALVLMLVAMIVVGVLTTLGGETSQVFDQVNCTMDGGTYHQDQGKGNSNKCK